MKQQIFVLVDWPACLGLLQSPAFHRAGHLVRSQEETPIGAPYMVTMEFAATNGLTGEHYRLCSGTPATETVGDYDGNAYVPMT